LETEVAAACFDKAFVREPKRIRGFNVLKVKIVISEAANSACLVASVVDFELLKKLPVGLVNRANSLTKLNDYLALGVLIGILDTTNNILGAAIGSPHSTGSKLLKDTEDRLGNIPGALFIIVHSYGPILVDMGRLRYRSNGLSIIIYWGRRRRGWLIIILSLGQSS
jgi:hypothetical protein